jgi:hypothetical protein
MAAIAPRPLGVEKHPLAGRRIGRAVQTSKPGFEIGGLRLISNALRMSRISADRQKVHQLERPRIAVARRR